MIRFWVSEFDVDGIRLDAADVLDFDFMKQLRRTAEEVKPDFWLMGEVMGEPGNAPFCYELRAAQGPVERPQRPQLFRDRTYCEISAEHGRPGSLQFRGQP